MVGLLMLVKVRALVKTFPTQAALVWFLPGVEPLVQFQGQLPPKAVPTLSTCVGFLPRVNTFVSFQL